VRDYCGPSTYAAERDRLFRSLGPAADGQVRFEDLSVPSGIAAAPGPAMGLATADFDGDGRLDLYVAHDLEPNLLWLQDGQRGKGLHFVNDALLLGCAVNQSGAAEASMGVDAADVDGDGDEDLFMTHLNRESNTLYVNDGTGLFRDHSLESGLANPSWTRTGFGTAFFDYDNDGWLDLLLVNGHVYPQIDQIDMEASAPYRQRRMLFRNRRDGTFEDVAPRYGGPLMAEQVSRGLAVGDLDDDGRLDVVINNLDGQPEILHNLYGEAGHWLQVQLEGRGKMRDGIGAVITVRSGKTAQTRTVHSGASYLSHHDLRQHFGLGEHSKVDSVEVRWPDGSTSKQLDVAADQTLVVRQQADDRAPE
jgi:hypothetical protein